MGMRRLKADFVPLTENTILERNPERKDLKGSKDSFKKLVVVSANTEPFDKKGT